MVVEERYIRHPAVPALRNPQHLLHHIAAGPAVVAVACNRPVEVRRRTAATAGHTVEVARTAVVAAEVGRSYPAHRIRLGIEVLHRTGFAQGVLAGQRVDSF